MAIKRFSFLPVPLLLCFQAHSTMAQTHSQEIEVISILSGENDSLTGAEEVAGTELPVPSEWNLEDSKLETIEAPILLGSTLREERPFGSLTSSLRDDDLSESGTLFTRESGIESFQMSRQEQEDLLALTPAGALKQKAAKDKLEKELQYGHHADIMSATVYQERLRDNIN